MPGDENLKRVDRQIWPYLIGFILIAIVFGVGKNLLGPTIGNVFLDQDSIEDPVGCVYTFCPECLNSAGEVSEYCSKCMKQCDNFARHADRQTNYSLDSKGMLLVLVISVILLLIDFGILIYLRRKP